MVIKIPGHKKHKVEKKEALNRFSSNILNKNLFYFMIELVIYVNTDAFYKFQMFNTKKRY